MRTAAGTCEQQLTWCCTDSQLLKKKLTAGDFWPSNG